MNEGDVGGTRGVGRWAAALTWHSTLREAQEGESTSAVAREWRHWYADAENQRIFEAVSRLLADRIVYRKRFRRGREELDADRYDLSIPIAEWRNRHAPNAVRRHCASVVDWWRWLSGGFVAVTAAAAALIIWGPPRFWSAAGLLGGPVAYQTNIGELKDVHLRDGSSITLGGRTELSIVFSGQRRSVKLIRGQAWFKVAHDPHWPFVVTAGDGVITDVGTAFVVTRENHRVIVTVTDGTVEVSTEKSPRTPRTIGQEAASTRVLTPIRVTEGEELAFSDKGALSPVMNTDVHAATAWTHGWLTFDDESLQDVVAAVDRYSSLQISASQSAGTLRFSGIVLTNEIDDWLRGLEKIFPVTVERRGTAVCIDVRDLTRLHRQANTACSTQP